MKKRLRKKKHIGEFTQWGVQLVVIRSPKDGFDDFFHAFVEEAMELNGFICGGGDKENVLDVVVELGGSRPDDTDGKMMKVTAWLNERKDVQSWRIGPEFDLWYPERTRILGPKIVSHQMKGEPKRVLTKEEDLLTPTKTFEYNTEDMHRQCEPEKMTLTKEDQEWINSSPVGKEI